MRRRRVFTSLALAAILAASATEVLAEIDPPRAAVSAQPAFFADLAARVRPAVVNISTVGKANRGKGHEFEGPRFPPGSPFEEYFRRFLEPQWEGNRYGSAPSEVRALGLGFIIDAGGLAIILDHQHAHPTSVAGTAPTLKLRIGNPVSFRRPPTYPVLDRA